MAEVVTENLHNEVVPFTEAIQIIDECLKGQISAAEATKVMESAVNSLPLITIEEEDFILLMDLRNFLTNLRKAVQHGDVGFLYQKRGLCVSRVADIEEFLESKEFMGQKGHIWPSTKYELMRLFTSEQFVEVVLTGAIGIGKNYFADLAMARVLYMLSIWHNPQVEFDLAPGSSIVLIMQSLNAMLARKVVFDQFAERLRLSPYFQNHFIFDKDIKSEMRFPRGISILPVGGNDTSAIGMNVFGGVLDELNFMIRTKESAYLRPGDDMYDKAERVYSSLIRRMKSRFMQKGKLPGKLFLVSSVNYPGDFTDRKIDEAKTDPTIFIMKKAAWEALPADRFCGDTFLVEVGNEIKQSRIIQSVEQALDEQDVIKVPVEYRSEFERDIDMALREIGGIASCAAHPFIPYRELIKKAQDEFGNYSESGQLFKVEQCIIQDIVGMVSSPDWENLVNLSYLEQLTIDPQMGFATHIDVGVTNDAVGIAIGHIHSYKLVPSLTIYNEQMGAFQEVKDVRAPVYMLDGLLRVIPPPSGEIDLELVRDLIVYLRGYQYIKYATMDSYQSTMMIQSFRKLRIRTGVLSVDTSIAPYSELKLSIKGERIIFPPHETGARELRELEFDSKKQKVDHPEKGSKDVTDAMAGVVYILQKLEASFGRRAHGRRSRDVADSEKVAEQQVRKVRINRGRRR